ncbi:xanthine dehydrogenase family protein molybdopterin-binding subunit [Pseudorhizobium flavum]|uniref:xanthine dehydrogenase family protein molybdopterin-binding subunit n=1 Tax=Pseudorhizobium flavum TaxID=1335061 RepID=UPI00248FAA40|nr:xanthine dehydrogenase family protein molybdopterin-binding subunit [Pseudorhizobium flavum]
MVTGMSSPRLDGSEKVTGRARYAADHQPSSCAIALALRADHAPARIRAIDVSRANALPGVLAIYTHQNAAHELGWVSSPDIDALGAEALGRQALGDDASDLPAYRPLTSDEVMFAGQWIAVVVAETIEMARQALALLHVDLEAQSAPSIDDILPGPFFAGDMQHSFETGHEAGAVVARIDETYETPMQLHQPMEPSASTAIWDEEGATVWDSTQGTQASRAYIAASLGIPADKVRVVSRYVGGGFGAKNQIWPHQALAAHLARRLKRPVRMQLTRQDMAVASGHRSETHQRVLLEADSHGRLSLLQHDSLVPTSLRGGFFEPCGLSSLMLYSAQRVSVSHRVRRLPISTPTPFRAPGETPGSFALETALDELADHLQIDPIELRLRNFAAHDAYHNRPWSSNHLRECYRTGADLIGWSNRSPAPRQRSREGRLVGLGMATTAYPAPALPATVRLRLHAEGRLRIETSATDIGTGMRTILAQRVAGELGLTLDEVEVHLGDSSLPDAPTAGRSKSTASVMPAAAIACRLLRNMLSADLRNVPLKTALAASGRSQIAVEGSSGERSVSPDMSFYSFGAHFVEVELDERICRLRVTRVVSVLDCGRIHNSKLAESQIRGGISFGVGMALMEEAWRHPKTNRVMTDNLADYAVPIHADMPDVEVLFLDHPDPHIGDIGGRGLGEIGLPGVAAAIGNALFNASGRRLRSTPFSLDKLTGVL